MGKLLDTITGEIIPSYLSQKYNVAVVCSARSGRDKASGSTSMLLQAASLAESREPSATRTLDGVIDLLISQHLDAARLALGGNGSGELLEELERDIVADCEAVRVFLHAAQVCGTGKGIVFLSLLVSLCFILINRGTDGWGAI